MLSAWVGRIPATFHRDAIAFEPVARQRIFRAHSFHMAVAVIILLMLVAPAICTKKQCCRDRGVAAACAELFCDPRNPPGDAEIYTAFEGSRSCKKYLPDIANCLSDGRDSTSCCFDTAERQDLLDCFGVCKGSTTAASEIWSKFQTCLVINLSTMYNCLTIAYRRSPSAPIAVHMTSKTSTSVNLGWKPPAKNPSLVVKYKVIFTETSGRRHTETAYETRDTTITVTTLQPDKKYTVYVIAQGEDQKDLSQASDFIQFTTSTRSQNDPIFTETVKLPREALTATLPCHLRQGAVHKGAFIWEKKERGNFKRVEGDRFKITTFSEKMDGLHYYVSALEINKLETSDYTVYRCHLEDERNDFGEIKLLIHSFVESVPKSPPESPLECCSKEVTRPHCQSACSGSIGLGKDVKPGAFLPQFRCFDEFNTLMKCTLQEQNNVACCIKRKVPYHCLGMCDSRFVLGNIFLSDCVNHVNKVLMCQEERGKNLPYAVSSLKVKAENDAISLEWEPSADAELYHVYHRSRRGIWSGGATTQIKTVTGPADEIAVLAVNKYGYSGVSRMVLVDDRWSSSFLT